MSRHLFTRIFPSLFRERERERHANSSSSPLPFFYYRTRSQHLFIWPSSSVGTTAGVSQFSGRHLCHRPMRPQHTFVPNIHLSYTNIKTVKGLVPNNSDWVDCCYNKKGKEQGTIHSTTDLTVFLIFIPVHFSLWKMWKLKVLWKQASVSLLLLFLSLLSPNVIYDFEYLDRLKGKKRKRKTSLGKYSETQCNLYHCMQITFKLMQINMWSHYFK